MLYAVKYSFRGDRSKERVAASMATFAERGDIPGTVAHYVALDASAGLVIVETDDVGSLYQATLAYQEWLEIDTTPIMTMEDAVPHIMQSLE